MIADCGLICLKTHAADSGLFGKIRGMGEDGRIVSLLDLSVGVEGF